MVHKLVRDGNSFKMWESVSQTFDIAPPALGAAVALTAATALSTNGDAIGDCLTDTFSVASPGNVGSPVICGINMGQHST